MSSIFSRNSEANASEFLENIEYHQIIISMQFLSLFTWKLRQRRFNETLIYIYRIVKVYVGHGLTHQRRAIVVTIVISSFVHY